MALRPATETDLDTIIELIHGLAEYEREPEAVRLDRETLGGHLFGPRPYAEVILAETDSGENITVSAWELQDPGDTVVAGTAGVASWNGCAWYFHAAKCAQSSSS